MKITLSFIKADVGSIGGHTRPSQLMMETVQSRVKESKENGLLMDGFVSFTGDDIAILMSHTLGEGAERIHRWAWDTFLEATERASEEGMYAAGQDLLMEAPSGNLRGAGPAVAELEFEHGRVKYRPAESFLIFAADKCGPGAYNLPFFLGFADPMYCAGLMLPKMRKGFRFELIDMDNTEGDSVLFLNAPEDYYLLTSLLRDNERFGIDSIYDRTHEEKVASISAQRLHSIAGVYTGKDDPIALVRTQGIFPAPEELLSPFTKAHYVGGDARGFHHMPLMPVPRNTPVTGAYCLPLVSCVGFSLDARGRFSENWVDFFDNPAWDYVRWKAQKKALEIRSQGWSGPAMLPYTELEYSGFRKTVEELVGKFRFRPSK